MRVLAFDPGAERLGWASLLREGGVNHHHLSGILALPRKDSDLSFQEYRLQLTYELTQSLAALFDLCAPTEVANEILPPAGFRNPTQSYLANVALTVVHVLAAQRCLPVWQYGANTIQTYIVPKGKKKTKVQVRNAVLELFPELQDRKRGWMKVFDEPDAIATAVKHLDARN